MTARPVGPSGPAAPAAVDAAPIARLLQQPQRFEFHQAVCLLERWLGGSAVPQRPALQFRNTLSLAFPASEIAALALESDARADAATPAGDTTREVGAPAMPDPATWRRIELTPAFMGLLGTGGALPLAYSETLAGHEARQRDGAARAFLDIFQHRAVTLFHAAWRKHRLPLQAGLGEPDPGLCAALSLAGLGQPALRERLRAAEGGVADDALAHHAGTLQRRCTDAGQLQALLADYLGVPVQVEQFVGRWCALAPDNFCSLGTVHATLGADTVLGERVWQRDLRLRVVLGPLGREQQRRFLPGQPGALALRELLTLMAGVSLEWEVRLRLRAQAVTAARLGGDEGGGAAQLGWSGFLLSRPSAAEREETVQALHAAAA
ncbi:type VI secretion system baseplate subunit TssG [Azohydromonas aeria]|uniref:type VI secretion system baseplate subunit TssG n=1 Tax=Azohydromonas aeria TaxID=2590212 RepID=UPI0012F76740|nr:type VI secretion system baseplate subunit TssG [Azohydromonas aeria]